jgi:hypothetical protein
MLAVAGPLFVETVTLPVAASVMGAGGVPFVSDVRVFNTSYPFACTNNDCGGDPQQYAGMVGFLIIE